jgi:hypothetical protein
MKYVNKETGETWTEGETSTSRTSNFYLLSHEQKVALGWELVAEPVIETPLEVLKSRKVERIKLDASLVIQDKYPIWKQLNALMGEYGSAYLDSMKAEIRAIRAKSDELESRVVSATSKQELDFDIVF